MKRTPLSLLAHWAGGELRGEDLLVDTLTNDTRSLMPGSLYVALRGERFDGHDFAYDAAMRNAAALLVDHAVEVDLPQVIVADTQLALARIASNLQLDRGGKAIARAIGEAAANDIVLIAGKGHEPYQEISGVRHPFDDTTVARQYLEERP